MAGAQGAGERVWYHGEPKALTVLDADYCGGCWARYSYLSQEAQDIVQAFVTPLPRLEEAAPPTNRLEVLLYVLGQEASVVRL